MIKDFQNLISIINSLLLIYSDFDIDLVSNIIIWSCAFNYKLSRKLLHHTLRNNFRFITQFALPREHLAQYSVLFNS